MRPLRYSINVTLDGCCDHRAIPADAELHRHAAETLKRADALIFGRTTYELMESAFGPSARTGEEPDFTDPFVQTIDAARKYVVSTTLEQVDWNAGEEFELVSVSINPRETHDLAKVMERYARAAAQAERAGIVAFLRERSATHHRIATSFKSSGDRDGASTHVSMSHTYGCAADAIERGEDKS